MPPPFGSWASDLSFPDNKVHSPQPQQVPLQQNKKPRHRHSPNQLAALNQLFDQNEHPPLEQRSALADRLGMETKTVNAWFQNKRASSKKRVRGGAVQYDPLPINTAPLPPPNPHPSLQNHDIHRHNDMDDMHDDDYSSVGLLHSRSASVVPPDYPPSPSFFGGLSDQPHFYSESDNVPRRMRMRPSSEQTDELRKLYNINPHPSTEQRQALSASIGMRYSSITNWFQNQRSLAKKRKEDEPESFSFAAPKAEYPHETRQYSAFPPPFLPHLSLSLPLPTTHPSLLNANSFVSPRSPSISPSMEEHSIEEHSPRRSSSYRSTTPYGSMTTSFARPRRSRPEPYQLDALKDLFTKTSTPTIEERSALALEIGMDVGKVTNWFRNLRQTARKRAKKSGSGDEEDDFDAFARDMFSVSLSRVATPSFGSSSSSSMNDDMDDFYMHHAHSDNGSEDEYQEAVTPSPEHSPSPPRSSVDDRDRPRKEYRSLDTLTMSYPVMPGKVSPTGINYDDAMLLISFQRGISGRDLSC